MEAKEIVERLQKEFPKSALKTRLGAGGKNFTYIEGHAAIHRMLDVAPDYSMEYVTHWVHTENAPNGKERVILNMLIYVDIPNMGRKLGHGVAVLGGGEDLAKGALTDAFKNALKYAGQGLSLYGTDYEAAPSPRKLLADTLKERGIDPIEGSNTRFGKEPKALTDKEVNTWLAELEADKTLVPF